MPQRLTPISLDGSELTIEALRQIAPSCITEVKDPQSGATRQVVNFDVLRTLLGDQSVEAGTEMYSFIWPGKQAARREAATPITDTLRPVLEDSVDWDSTENLYIEGDNLSVLKLLQRSYVGKVKMIYIDPPYNTGNDFIYNDDYTTDRDTWALQSGERDEDGNQYRKNLDTNGRFHSDWCSMIYSRLLLSRSLLTDDGVIFISIDDNEVHNLRKICDEVFGASNFIAQFIWSAGRKNDAKLVSISHEYILCYAKTRETLKDLEVVWRERKRGLDDIYKAYNKIKSRYPQDYVAQTKALKSWFKNLPDGHPAKDHKHYSRVDEKGVYFPSDISWPGGGGPKYELINPETGIKAGIPSRGWITSEETMLQWVAEGRVDFGTKPFAVPTLKAYLKDRELSVPYSVFYQDGRAASKRLATLMGGKVFENPKDEEILQKIIEFVGLTDGDIVLDFFSGSASTAHAVMLANAHKAMKIRYIMVQIAEEISLKTASSEKSKKVAQDAIDLCDSLSVPHTIPEIAKERIRRAGRLIQDHLIEESLKASMEMTYAYFGEDKDPSLRIYLEDEETREEAEERQKDIIKRQKAIDTGFRVFRLDSSNFIDVKRTPAELGQGELDLMLDNVKTDRSGLDLLYGAMLSWGLSLSLPQAVTVVDGCEIYNVDEGELVACFAKAIPTTVIEAIADMQPKRVLLRDSSFASDKEKINTFELLKQHLNWDDKEALDKVRVI